MKTIEYRVRPVTRYVVTRWYAEDHANGCCSGGCEGLGEFDNESAAQRVMIGMASHEHEGESLPLSEDGMSSKWTEE